MGGLDIGGGEVKVALQDLQAGMAHQQAQGIEIHAVAQAPEGEGAADRLAWTHQPEQEHRARVGVARR